MQVGVTAHACQWQDEAELAALQQQYGLVALNQQWRVLHFFGAGPTSDQSVARVTTGSDQNGEGFCRMQADCLPFQYTKTLAAVGETLVRS